MAKSRLNILKEKNKSFVLIVDDLSSYGGATSFVYKLLQIHKRKRIPTTIVVPESSKDALRNEVLNVPGFRVLVIPDRPKFFRRQYFSLIFDIYIYFYILLFCNPAAIVVSSANIKMYLGLFFVRKPLYYFLHSMQNKLQWSPRLQRKIFSRGARSKRFICVSHAAKKSLIANTPVCPGAVDVVYNSTCASGAVCLGKEKGGFDVLTIGHVIHYKNPHVWYAVVKKVISVHPEIRFFWLGNGPLLEGMKSHVLCDGLQSHVYFEGFSVDVGKYYKSSSLYFQPSRLESHSIAIIDAMAFSLPVVASNVGGNPESIVDGSTGFLCDADDVDRYSSSIVRLYNDRALAVKMGRDGRLRAENLFSELGQERCITNIYKTCEN